MTINRDYDSELIELLEKFRPHNTLVEQNIKSSLVESNQPIVTLKWIDKENKRGE